MASPRLVFDRLFRHYGPQRWWPAETPFEVVVGALLMAQTAWKNVEAAIDNLGRAGLLNPQALARADLATIRKHVRPAGLYRQKPARLRGLCRHLLRVADGDLPRFFARGFETLREELLGLEGVGPETADSILLYAAEFPTFVVDAYTVRIGTRLGWFPEGRKVRYEEAKAFFETRLEPTLALYREYHALLVAHGKTTCRPRPRCEICPVRAVCAYYQGRKRKEG